MRWLGYLWALPHSLVGLLLMVYYWPRSFKWRDGCLEIISKNTLIGGPWVGAQTHGWVIFYKDEHNRDHAGLNVHERVHVKQGMTGGVFFVLAYGACFLWELVRGSKAPPVGVYHRNFDEIPRWRRAYYNIWFERKAYLKGHQHRMAPAEEKIRYWGHR